MKIAPEVIEEVSSLIRSGLSYSQIADQVNREKADALARPLTRSSVSGIVHRGKLRAQGVRSTPPRIKKKPVDRWFRPAPVEFQTPKPYCTKIEPEDVARISLAEMEARHCRWPVGDPRDRDFGYCGLLREHPFDARRPYCEIHRKRSRASGASE